MSLYATGRPQSKVAVALLVLLLFSCTDDSDHPRTATDGCIDLELVARLGKIGDPASIGDSRNIIVRRASAVGWIVAEANQGKPAMLYGHSGEFKGTVGSIGDGPLEYGNLGNIIRGPDSLLWMFDFFGKIIKVDEAGHIVKAAAMADGGGNRADAFHSSGWSAQMYYRKISPDTLRGYAIIRDSHGDSALTVGPGGASPVVDRPVVFAYPSRILMADPQSVFAPSYVSFTALWTPESTQPWVDRSEVWRSVSSVSRRPETPVDSGYVVGLERGGDRAVWGLVKVPGDNVDAGTGVLWMGREDGRVLSAVYLGEEPYGFADSQFHYTVVQVPNGLREIRIWRHSSACGTSGGQ